MQNNRYPGMHIWGKNELAKRISGHGLTKNAALDLINDVLANYDKYWRDHPHMSQPNKGKWVRNASYTKLGKLLKLINKRVLQPYDNMLPDFIYGGITGKNHKAAAKELLGRRRNRVMLKLDVTRFFEQIHGERVEKFFATKADCGNDGAVLLANLCCVAIGAKDAQTEVKSLARGFATSSRLAAWCNLDTFIRLERLVKKEFRGKDPRIAIYVDDIGITASGATKEEMIALYVKVKAILESDANQPLPLNDDKTKIIFHSGDTYGVDGIYQGKWSFEILGQQLNRNKVVPGSKTRWKLADIQHKIKSKTGDIRVLKRRKRALDRYSNYLQK